MNERETVIITGATVGRAGREDRCLHQGDTSELRCNPSDNFGTLAKFAVHLGVARSSSVIVEQTGKNSGYRDRDVCGFCPESNFCIEGGPEKLDSVVNMRAVSKCFKRAGMDVIYSRDAGRYLCDFAYYCSLYHSQRRAAFIHIPSSGSLASPDTLVPILQALILTMLQHLEDTKQHEEQHPPLRQILI
ncbi:pyroglutamyl-peptidase 1-like protein isoform X3 [Melanotaenia boesemani]|uniref:pyroglutamyl-peptidase 1-like protein isoform X3 n=1 Tax=Melanotaenia boesemani TaxID=1250792 RepID=UPI001C0404C5|nr:pyroglutamyl-peptidase 1-like protein isoform X3 [Melanotaenia boesemani]